MPRSAAQDGTRTQVKLDRTTTTSDLGARISANILKDGFDVTISPVRWHAEARSDALPITRVSD